MARNSISRPVNSPRRSLSRTRIRLRPAVAANRFRLRQRPTERILRKRFPIEWSHSIDQKSLQIQKLEHILVDQTEPI
ncbi:hypothetical protein MPC4_180080 [Methylocella tundrae]|uniref:Uncharacterized protein n=1 Tax=Methylocella tundrae TaxID=227605 RepID=A0A8B6M4D4_METTU|nr:hypothetical protein MPC1_2410003 [Methylocella tundrae]VTZ49674.1 hypothetical protein MPC4_180080 [Methylocella tundrae]